MLQTILDCTDRKLISLLQTDFPFTEKPYLDIGLRLGISGDEVIARIKVLKDKGLIRQISPIIDGKMLGYKSTLVALKIPPDKLAPAEKMLGSHPGVSHGYEREYDFNVWITLAVPPKIDIEHEAGRLAVSTGAELVINLPAVRMFKLRAVFGLDESNAAELSNNAQSKSPSMQIGLSPLDKRILNELQQDLPLIEKPFSLMAEKSDITVADFLAKCLRFHQFGLIRRFGASINHRTAGYTANGMTCWTVPENKVDIIGGKLASLRQVSHCYERRTNNLWRYSMFAMIHSHTKEDCLNISREFSLENDLDDYVTLFSTKEFKKTRLKYVV